LPRLKKNRLKSRFLLNNQRKSIKIRRMLYEKLPQKGTMCANNGCVYAGRGEPMSAAG
jgi:hypothetical protein